MLSSQLANLAARSVALTGAPIDVRSALDRVAQTRTASARPASESAGGGGGESEGDSPFEDDNAPQWPDAAMEDAMRAEIEQREPSAAEAARKPRRQREDTLDGGPLPALDDLIAKIPAPVRTTLEELFRAQFQGVRRVPLAVLKDPPKSV